MSDAEPNSGVTAAGQELAGTAADKAGQVSQQASEEIKAVAGTAVEQARQVGGQAAARAGDVLGETKDQARRQAEMQTQRLAESLGRLRDQGRAFAAGRPHEAGSLPRVAEEMVSRLDQVVERIDRGGFEGMVNDVQRFARRRPGMFLLGAGALGLAVGRLLRAGAAQHATAHSDDARPVWPDPAAPGAGPARSDLLAGSARIAPEAPVAPVEAPVAPVGARPMSTTEPPGGLPRIQRIEPSLERSPAPPTSEASLGELMSRMTDDLSTLFRKEVELAKIEVKEEAGKAAKGAGLLGGTAVAALFCLLMLSFAAAWGLAEVMPTGVAFLLMGALYAIAAAILFVVGRDRLRQVRPVPAQTVETVKEDIQWAKNPTP